MERTAYLYIPPDVDTAAGWITGSGKEVCIWQKQLISGSGKTYMISDELASWLQRQSKGLEQYGKVVEVSLDRFTADLMPDEDAKKLKFVDRDGKPFDILIA